MKDKIVLVTGVSGFVGGAIMRDCQGVIPCPSLKNATQDEVFRIVEESGAHAVVHTAAISDIGACARDPEGSYRANVLLPVYLAKACRGRKLICFSSDQVYSGFGAEGPYTEDTVNPGNLYAEHKLEMENRVLDIDPDAVMLRAEWMYDHYLKKSNYFMNMINARGKVFASSQQYRGVTYVREVCENMERVLSLPGGAYNFGSETDKSMYEITKAYLIALGKDVEVEDGPSCQNLWMNCQKARNFGVDFSKVEDGLLRCARDYNLIKK